jgi:hypothetical protein
MCAVSCVVLPSVTHVLLAAFTREGIFRLVHERVLVGQHQFTVEGTSHQPYLH